jgi:hypothetical protein
LETELVSSQKSSKAHKNVLHLLVMAIELCKLRLFLAPDGSQNSGSRSGKEILMKLHI